MRTLLALLLAAATISLAGAPKSYQVTGPVTEVKDGLVSVQKGKEVWQIDAGTSAPAGLKVGDKVTIMYTMTAKSIDVKAAPAAKAPKDAKAKK